MSKRNWLKHLGFATAAAIATSKEANMTDEDYKQLEHLLGLLENEIGNKICIIPNHIHGGYHVGVYSGSSGKPIKDASGPTIKDTVNKLKATTNEH